VLAIDGGDTAEAERLYQAALRLPPRCPTIYVNPPICIARRAASRRRARAAQGLEIAPDSADLHHALGLMLVRRSGCPTRSRVRRARRSSIPT
jgi:Flp pilus assembly protein TadD